MLRGPLETSSKGSQTPKTAKDHPSTTSSKDSNVPEPSKASSPTTDSKDSTSSESSKGHERAVWFQNSDESEIPKDLETSRKPQAPKHERPGRGIRATDLRPVSPDTLRQVNSKFSLQHPHKADTPPSASQMSQDLPSSAASKSATAKPTTFTGSSKGEERLGTMEGTIDLETDRLRTEAVSIERERVRLVLPTEDFVPKKVALKFQDDYNELYQERDGLLTLFVALLELNESRAEGLRTILRRLEYKSLMGELRRQRIKVDWVGGEPALSDEKLRQLAKAVKEIFQKQEPKS